jgi:hypothetical protein
MKYVFIKITYKLKQKHILYNITSAKKVFFNTYIIQ